jgi:hypothetical protein
MASSQPKLLTTTTRIVLAIILTAYLFTMAVREALFHQSSSYLLIDHFFGVKGAWLMGVNVILYAYLCWLAFCYIGGTAGRERLFMLSWFAGILPWPLVALKPEWSTAEAYVSIVAFGMALFSAGSLLAKRHGEPDRDRTPEAS